MSESEIAPRRAVVGRRSHFGRLSALVAALAFTVLLAAGCDQRGKTSSSNSQEPVETVTIAIAPYAGTAAVYIASAKGFFEEEGLKVAVQIHSSGKVALDTVLEGKADIATVADLPFALAALKGQPVSLLATLATGAGDYGIVGRKDRGITGPATLKGKRIAVTFGASGDFFLDALLVRHRLSRADVQVMNRKPEEMADTLQSGEADAVSTWEPYVSVASKRLGGNAIAFSSAGIYDSTFNVAATQEFAGKRAGAVKKMLRALVRAEDFYASDRPAAERIVAEALKTSVPEAQQLLSKHRFGLSLDQGLLVMMEDEARWAMRSKLVEEKALPNFLANIQLTELLSVKPRAVTVIH